MEQWLFYGLGIIVAVVGYFLRQKDEAQAKQIATLWIKHDEDAEKLQNLELRIASEHYVKRELDGKFDRLDASIRDGLEGLGKKFDKLSDAMMAHISSK